MRYVPGSNKDNSSQPKYTAGLKYMFKDGNEYKGNYHIYKDKPYSNSEHNDSSLELFPFSNDYNLIKYYSLKDIRTYVKPNYYVPKPTQKDYDKGTIDRYFIIKRNDDTKIIEVDKKQFLTLNKKNSGLDGGIYKGIKLMWKITGPINDIYKNNILVEYGIEDTNKRTIKLKSKEVRNIDKVFYNYIELSKI